MTDIGTQGFSRTKRFDQEARLERIQNAKERTIGVDKDALEKQMKENKAAKESDKKLDQFYSGMAQYFDGQLLQMEQQRQQIKREMAVDVIKFREENQQKSTAKEYDLNDPDSVKNSLPARVGDEDERNGISSMQKFEGEDLDSGERRKLQLAQQKAWCEAQIAEKEAKAASLKEQEDAYCSLTQMQVGVQNTVQSDLNKARHELRMSTAEYNRQLAADKRAKEDAANASNLTENEAEQAFIAEKLAPYNVSIANVTAPHRVRTDHYIGMAPSERADIVAFQAAQRDELAERKEAARLEELKYNAMQNGIYNVLDKKTQEQMEFMKEQRMAVAERLKQQQAEKKERDAELEKTINTNVPTDAFFKQFGNTSR